MQMARILKKCSACPLSSIVSESDWHFSACVGVVERRILTSFWHVLSCAESEEETVIVTSRELVVRAREENVMPVDHYGGSCHDVRHEAVNENVIEGGLCVSAADWCAVHCNEPVDC